MYRLLALSAALATSLVPSPAMADHYDRYYGHRDHDNGDEVAAAVIGGVIGLVTGYAIGSNRYYGYRGYGYYGQPYGYGYYGGYRPYGYAAPAYPYPPPPPAYGYGAYGSPYPYGYYGGYRPYGGAYVAPYGGRYAYRPRYYYRR